MSGDALAFVEYLDGALGDPGPELLFGQGMGHRIVMLGDLDMIIEAGAALLPFGVLVWVARQRLQRRLVERLEQLPARCAQVLCDAPVHLFQQFMDGLVQLGEAEETAIAQPGQDPALDDLDANLYFRLIARFARPRKPRDKAKVEVGVQVVERWVLARLRNRRFFSLAELNQAIHELLEEVNRRVTKHLGASRRQLFEALDQPALKPLPGHPYQYAEWKQRRAGLDYHVEVAKHYYSVPHALAKQKLWARITERTVEIFHKGKRVAAHMRGSGSRRHTTVAEHMPSSHRRYANWTPDRIRRDAAANGPHTEILIDVILRSRPHPEQGFRSCIGILRLAKTHGGERLEAACERALEIGARSYSSLASILKNNLDRRTPRRATDGPAIDHPNIRGPQYFH